ncbi:MAG: peptidase S10 [Acidobacteriaceae bacterium]|nr:peptidase S10 [Acidobacteriaceae bacterium]
MKRSSIVFVPLVLGSALALFGQQANPPKAQVQKTTPTQTTPKEQPERPPSEVRQNPQPEPAEQHETQRANPTDTTNAATPDLHFDMTEVAPSVTHHQMHVGGKLLHYTATAGRLPIKDQAGKTDALMFYVAYTLDGVDSSTRPLTFAFNGGPGSASIWLHMGALGPRKVVLQKNGFMPAAPYRLEDNADTLLDKSDLVLVDAIGTGFSRPANMTAGKKYWGVKGDIQAFGEFIRLYITRNERWSSPLYLLGESYGTTRSAGVSGYLADQGISFNGIVLLSTVLAFQTLEFSRTNDEPYPLILPTYTLIAAYHHKLAPELSQNLEKTRAEVEQWATNEYTKALAKGDTLSGQERQSVIDALSRYTGLSKDIIDQYNLRVDVQGFTHYLLADQKLRVGRLDGRFAGPDPEGFTETRFYDPTSSETGPPFTSVFNDYVRRELNYKTDMPYYTTAYTVWGANMKWDWGSIMEGYPDTAIALREAMVKNPYLKIRVLEGYYDLATPYYAANYTMDHMDLASRYRNNISYGTFDSGHMVYLDANSLKKMKENVAEFIDHTAPSPTQ